MRFVLIWETIRRVIRGWKLPLRSDKSLENLSRMFDPIIRGWIQYYGRFYRSGSTLSCGTSTACLPDGPRGNTRSCDTIFGERSSGCCASLGAIHGSLCSVALQWGRMS